MRGPFVTSTQPPAEDLRNALQVIGAQLGAGNVPAMDYVAFESVARLIRHALDGLGEPNAAAIRAARSYLFRCEYSVTGGDLHNYGERDFRDCAAAVIRAQLSGSGLSEERNPRV